MSYSPLKTWDGVMWRPSPPPPSASTNPAAGANSTTTTLSVSPTNIDGSGTVTLTATVSGTPTGSVIFEYKSGTTWVAISTDTGSPWTATKAINAQTSFRARYLGNGTAQPSTSQTKTVTTKTLKTFTKTYNCNGSRAFSDSGALTWDNHIYQATGSLGTIKSIMTFPTTIETDLTGADSIVKVEVFLNVIEWDYASGGTAVFKTHSNSSLPSTWGGVANESSTNDSTGWATKSGGKWCDISGITGILTVGNWVASPTIRGVLIKPASSSAQYNGVMSGNGEANEPQLRITYKKYV